MPHHINDAIAAACGASGPEDLLTLAGDHPALAPLATAIATTCAQIASHDVRLARHAKTLRGVEFDFRAEDDGGGDPQTLRLLTAAGHALTTTVALYAARLELARRLDGELRLYTAAEAAAGPAAKHTPDTGRATP